MSQGAKPATQARSRATRDKLVAALEQLLRERTFEEISMADLAKQAGLAVGTVYRRFENKEAFIPVIFELYLHRLQERMATPEGRAEIEPDEGLRAALRVIVEKGWAFAERDGHLIRAAHVYAHLRPDLVGAEWDDLLESSVAGFGQLLDFFPDEVAHTDADNAARMMTYLLNTVLTEKALYKQDGVGVVLKQSDAVFIQSVADTLYGYLTTAPDPDAT